MLLIISTLRCRTYGLLIQTTLKTILKQISYGADVFLDVYKLPSIKHRTKIKYTIEHQRYAIGEKILDFAINNECKKLDFANDKLKIKRVPELWVII